MPMGTSSPIQAIKFCKNMPIRAGPAAILRFCINTVDVNLSFVFVSNLYTKKQGEKILCDLGSLKIISICL